MKSQIKDKNKSGIYCIINKINNKKYIGKAKCIHKRIKAHISDCNKKNKDENPYLINSWHKYGRNNFEYFVLEYLDLNDNLLSKRELYWQKKFNVTDRNKGYNLRLDSSTKMIVHNDTRIKISKRLKKEWSEGIRKNHSKKLSDNWKLTPERNKIQSEIMSKNLTKYKYILYNLSNTFLKECTYKELKELKLQNVQAEFYKKKLNKLKFKNYIIERLIIKDIV